MKIGLFFELLSLFEPFHRVADGVLVWACSLFVRAAYSFIRGHNLPCQEPKTVTNSRNPIFSNLRYFLSILAGLGWQDKNFVWCNPYFKDHSFPLQVFLVHSDVSLQVNELDSGSRIYWYFFVLFTETFSCNLRLWQDYKVIQPTETHEVFCYQRMTQVPEKQ